jgi:hypothetical protein
MGHIMDYDHSLGQKDILKFIYYFIILMGYDRSLGQKDILKFVYYFVILFLIYL